MLITPSWFTPNGLARLPCLHAAARASELTSSSDANFFNFLRINEQWRSYRPEI